MVILGHRVGAQRSDKVLELLAEDAIASEPGLQVQ